MKKQQNNSCILLLILSTSLLAAPVSSLNNGDSCITPNQENGKCIPVNDCQVIRRAITYLNEEAVKFAKASQCGYDDGPLVCCGTVGRFTTPAPEEEVTTTRKPFTSLDVPPATPIHNALLPDETLCGFHPEGSRTTGKIAGMAEFPWTAALHYNNGANGDFMCSGALINNRHVITAADCLFIPGVKLDYVRLGEWKFSEKIEVDENGNNPVLDIPVDKVVFHPYYNNRTGNDNIALIRLKSKVQYSDFIRPICLPPLDFPPPPAETVMETSGWALTKDGSKSDVRMKANILMADHEECQKTFPRYTRRFSNRVCAKPTQLYDFCNGEAGAPLVKSYTPPKESAVVREEQWYIEGIIPKGFGCNLKKENDGSKDLSLYLRVSGYVAWIINNIRT